LWLVKWLLAIPHFIVLLFLWGAFLAVSVVATDGRFVVLALGDDHAFLSPMHAGEIDFASRLLDV
jgi:hypothetical protein